MIIAFQLSLKNQSIHIQAQQQITTYRNLNK